jgi:hypothetical protein
MLQLTYWICFLNKISSSNYYSQFFVYEKWSQLKDGMRNFSKISISLSQIFYPKIRHNLKLLISKKTNLLYF